MDAIKALDPARVLSPALPQPYLDLYVPQQNRPEAMGYFEELVAAGGIGRVEEIVDEKEASAAIAVGSFCVYSPEELVLAVGGIHFSLCSGTEIATDEVEKYIPRNTCALIKGLIGFRLSGKCPYMQVSDLIIGETTCDGKKKAYETLAEISPAQVFVMSLPNTKTEDSKKLWINEIKRCAEKVEEISGRKITVEGLKKAFNIVNARRQAQQRLQQLRSAIPAPISGLDALLVNQFASSADPVRVTHAINELCDELEERIKAGVGVTDKNAKRIIVGGSPMAMPNWKVPGIIENTGAVIVGEESCVGTRTFQNLLDTSFETLEEGYTILAERHMKMDCACFTPNDERPANIMELSKSLHADGYVHYALQFCTPFMMEAFKVKRATEENDLSFLKIETDYSQEDVGQLKTRIEAFVEML